MLASVIELLYCPRYEELQQEILNNIFDSLGNSSLSEFLLNLIRNPVNLYLQSRSAVAPRKVLMTL